MRRLLAVCLVLVVTMPLLSTAAAQDQTPQASDQATWLLVLHGDVAVATEDEIVLVADPRVVAFTDRPERQARVLDTQAVIEEAWSEDSSFRQDPPNAVVAAEASDDTGVITIEDVTQQGPVLTLRYDLLEGTVPAVGERAILTIDGLQFHFGPGP